MEILKYKENDVLESKAKQIGDINDEVFKLIQAMKETLYNTPGGIGLAAPQVGESLALSLIDLAWEHNESDPVIIINPRIMETDGKKTDDEGCLSFPLITASVNRATKILVKFHNTDGREITRELEGFIARVFQHEVDHLNGILIIDRLSSLKRHLLKKEIKKLKQNDQW